MFDKSFGVLSVESLEYLVNEDFDCEECDIECEICEYDSSEDDDF